MSTLPQSLQDSIDENVRLAQWRAEESEKNREKEAAAAKAAEAKAKEEAKPIKLKKDGTIAKKRGPKPKVKKEDEQKVEAALNETPVVVKKEKTVRKPKCSAWEEIENPPKMEKFLGNTVVGFLDDVSDIFIEHLYSLVNRSRRERKKATK